jgi:hypothetical protein
MRTQYTLTTPSEGYAIIDSAVKVYCHRCHDGTELRRAVHDQREAVERLLAVASGRWDQVSGIGAHQASALAVFRVGSRPDGEPPP